jgi:hypothetical protein
MTDDDDLEARLLASLLDLLVSGPRTAEEDQKFFGPGADRWINSDGSANEDPEDELPQ